MCFLMELIDQSKGWFFIRWIDARRCPLFNHQKSAPFDAVLGSHGLVPILLHVWPVVGGILVPFLTEFLEEVLLSFDVSTRDGCTIR